MAKSTAQTEIEAMPPSEQEAMPPSEQEAMPPPEQEATPQTAANPTAPTDIEATPRPEPDATPQAETQPDSLDTAQPETQVEPVVGTTESSAPRQPTSAPAPPPRPRTSQQPVGFRTYTVQRGDILKQIAARYGVSMASIMANNTIPNPDSLRIGQVLTIPPPGS